MLRMPIMIAARRAVVMMTTRTKKDVKRMRRKTIRHSPTLR